MTWRLSLRLPPTLDSKTAEDIVRSKIFEKSEEVFGAHIEFKVNGVGNGFDAPKLPDDLMDKLLISTKVAYGDN
jgi:hypothetical protein